MKAGYDEASQRLGVFDGSKFPKVGSSLEEARRALDELKEVIREFPFASEYDLSATISAILTATVRAGLGLAPAYHVRAPASGTGKSFLAELIGLFAGPGTPARLSFPKSADEAMKAMLAVLLNAPAVIEFDDMDDDWRPFGAINSMLTSTSITGRILGVSKTATVSTAALVLGSGNNVGPVRDLARRVVTINLDTRSEMPGAIRYTGNPVLKVRGHREKYVAAVFTIIEAWKAAGCPKSDVRPIASYNGSWSDMCRHPLIWLGLPDPAHSLFEQMRNDPDAEILGNLLTAWHGRYGDMAMPIRKVLDVLDAGDLRDAIEDLPCYYGGSINRSKFGHYLKKHANRIVGGLMLEKAANSERNAWKVVKMEGGEPASPLYRLRLTHRLRMSRPRTCSSRS
ncbi:hypothetical protein ACFSLT_03210 [Novosphingobium resinovorum]